MNARPLLLASLLALSATAGAQSAYVPLKQRLTAEQWRETGLDLLTPAQLAALDRLLAADATSAARARDGREAGPASPRERRIAVRARLVGPFTGWRPGMVLELDSGERWRVTEGELHVSRIDAPGVTIRPGLLSGWYLQVDGHAPTAKVTPVD